MSTAPIRRGNRLNLINMRDNETRTYSKYTEKFNLSSFVYRCVFLCFWEDADCHFDAVRIEDTTIELKGK